MSLNNLSNGNKKVIFLEGLPGVGKTAILNHIFSLNLENIKTVDEIINKEERMIELIILSIMMN